MKPVKNLNRAEVKMMLNYVGIPLEDQPVKIKELRALLSAYETTDAKGYRDSYNFVVEQKSPRSSTEKVVAIADARDIISEELSIIKGNTISQIESSFRKDGKKVLDNILQSFSEAVEKESKKFNIIKHVIYTGRKKTKEIEGVLCEEFETILQLAKERINILMVGPSGCGKTYCAEKIAEAVGLKYASQSCSSGVSESAFAGKLLPTGESGRFEYVESDFVRIYENGGIFLFDEIDAADSNVLVFLNQSLANSGFHCSQRIGNTYVKKHKNFIAIAAANTFGLGADSLYTGRNSLDASTMDRFRMGTVVMKYSESVEESIVDPQILQFGRQLRGKISKHRLKKILSTRFMEDATIMKNSQQWSIDKIQNTYLSDWSKEEIAVIGGKINFYPTGAISSELPSSKNSSDPDFDNTMTLEDIKDSIDRAKGL